MAAAFSGKAAAQESARTSDVEVEKLHAKREAPAAKRTPA